MAAVSLGGGPPYYGRDLAFVHDTGYSDFARDAAPGLVALLRRAGITSGFIVEVGCGSGAATRALVAAGHRVLGLDASPEMVRLARRRVPHARFAVGRLPDASLPPCDAVAAVSEVLNYMNGRAAFDRFFRRAFAALRPGGLLVFDVREPAGDARRSGRASEPVTRGRVGRDWAVLAVSSEDPRRGTLTRAITTFRRAGRGYRRTEETHRLTLLPASDLARRLRAAGFTVRVARAYGSFRLPRGHALLVARKPSPRPASFRRHPPADR
jgi:SAM-dependent methyltransferase